MLLKQKLERAENTGAPRFRFVGASQYEVLRPRSLPHDTWNSTTSPLRLRFWEIRWEPSLDLLFYVICTCLHLTDKLIWQNTNPLQQSITGVQVGLVSNGGQGIPPCSLGAWCAMRSLFSDSAYRSHQLGQLAQLLLPWQASDSGALHAVDVTFPRKTRTRRTCFQIARLPPALLQLPFGWLLASLPLGLQVHHTSLLLLEASHAAVIISQTECQLWKPLVSELCYSI